MNREEFAKLPSSERKRVLAEMRVMFGLLLAAAVLRCSVQPPAPAADFAPEAGADLAEAVDVWLAAGAEGEVGR